jgi:uncharacterized protein
MFLRFRVANYRSIREEVELSFVADEDSPFGRPLSGQDGLRVLPAVAIYGANASGKSTVLNALTFLSESVRQSHRSWEPDGGTPREPFALDKASHLEPSLFEVDLVVEGVRVAYGFELDDEYVTAEWIYAWPNGRKQVWLERCGTDVEFGRLLLGENRAVADFTRANSLFLSAAAQNNHAQLMPLYRSLTLGIATPHTPNQDTLSSALASTALALRGGRRDRVVSLVKLADLGIEDVIDLAAPTQAQLELPGLAVDWRPEPVRRSDSSSRSKFGSTSFSRSTMGARPYSRSTTGGTPSVDPADLRFRHSGETPHLLTVGQESAGTLSWFALVGQLLEVMDSGGLLCFDELDATLHPALVSEVVSLFQDVSTNPNGAQLLAACHDTTVLSPSTENHLRRDQVWLTEKADDGSTSLTPLSDYRIRTDQNLEMSYRQGRFGGLPIVNAHHLASALTDADDVA